MSCIGVISSLSRLPIVFLLALDSSYSRAAFKRCGRDACRSPQEVKHIGAIITAKHKSGIMNRQLIAGRTLASVVEECGDKPHVMSVAV